MLSFAGNRIRTLAAACAVLAAVAPADARPEPISSLAEVAGTIIGKEFCYSDASFGGTAQIVKWSFGEHDLQISVRRITESSFHDNQYAEWRVMEDHDPETGDRNFRVTMNNLPGMSMSIDENLETYAIYSGISSFPAHICTNDDFKVTASE